MSPHIKSQGNIPEWIIIGPNSKDRLDFLAASLRQVNGGTGKPSADVSESQPWRWEANAVLKVADPYIHFLISVIILVLWL